MSEFYPDDYDETEYNDYERFHYEEEIWEYVPEYEPDYSDLAAEEAFYRSWRGRLWSLKTRIRQFFINLYRKFFPYKIKMDDIPF